MELVHRIASSGEQVSELPEPESQGILATHYLPTDSNATTPRLSSVPDSRHDHGSFQQDVHPNIELPLPRFPRPQPASLSPVTTSTITPLAEVTSGVQRQSTSVGDKFTDHKSTGLQGTIHGIRRVASDGTRWGKTFSVTVPSSVSVVAPKPVRMHSKDAGEVVPDITAKAEGSAVEDETDTLGQRERGSAMKEAMRSNKTERSSSRGPSTHVEKNIEATLADKEPASNVRSRKSSHYLGLFKENTTSPDPKKRDDRGKDRGGKDKERDLRETEKQRKVSVSKVDQGEPVSHGAPSPRPDHPKTTSQPTAKHSRAAFSERLVLDKPSHDELGTGASSPVPDVSNESKPSEIVSQQPELSLADDVSTDQTKVFAPNRQILPLRLLEEIRNYHNLTPGPDRGSSFSRSIPTQIADREGVLFQTSPPSDRESTDDGEKPRRGKRKGSEDVEEDDEDKEHISSAVYFPHQGPSPEDVEHLQSLEEQLEELQRRGSFSTPTSPTSDTAQSSEHAESTEHVDISLQSKHQSRFLHGDFQPLEEKVDHASDRPLLTISEHEADSASGSEIESGNESAKSALEDDSSLTDDAKITPTATPTLGSRFPRPTRKHLQATVAPFGAVELKPFSHQVGGHSTVFRFSRRAVCKQLSNRENEFYERIERRHPEMLRFIPRFVTLYVEHLRSKVDAETSAKLHTSVSSPSLDEPNMLMNCFQISVGTLVC